MKYLPSLVLVLAGSALTTQSAANSQLRGNPHSVIWAVLASYLVGTLAAALVLASTQTPLPPLMAVQGVTLVPVDGRGAGNGLHRGHHFLAATHGRGLVLRLGS